MGTLRRVAVGAVAVVALVVALPTAASAEELTVTGSFAGTGTLAGPPCPNLPVSAETTGDWTGLGPVALAFSFCLLPDEGGNHWPVVDTTFTVTAADGSLHGSFTGYVEAGASQNGLFPLHFVATVTGGTGRYEGATGELAMEGAFGPGASTAEGTVDGTVTLASRTPDSVEDCKHGGWRDLVDHEGNPFRNQGQCIRWVHDRT